MFALYYSALSETQTSYWSFIEIQLFTVVTYVSADEVTLKLKIFPVKKALWVLDANFVRDPRGKSSQLRCFSRLTPYICIQ